MKTRLLVWGLLLAPLQVMADPARTAAIISKVLSFERTLAERATDSVTVSVVFRGGDAAAETEARALEGAFKALAPKVRTAVVQITVTSSNDALPAAASAVVFCGDDGAHFDPVFRASREKGLLSIGLSRVHAQRFASVAVFAEGEQTKIAVNVQNTRADRVQLNSALMRVAEVL